MCLAIAVPKGVIVKEKYLRNGFTSNNQGAGLAWVHHGEILIDKGFFEFGSFYKAYEKIKGLPALIHFRTATSGLTDATNCHPFMIDDDHAMIHNGIISIDRTNNASLSDTGTFVDLVLKPIFRVSREVHKLPAFRFLMDEALGSFNRIAIMDSSGEFVIYNKANWHEHEGATFSNRDYEWERYRTKTNPGKHGFKHYDDDVPRGFASAPSYYCASYPKSDQATLEPPVKDVFPDWPETEEGVDGIDDEPDWMQGMAEEDKVQVETLRLQGWSWSDVERYFNFSITGNDET